MRRTIVIVLDGCGAGEAPDAELFGDKGADTLKHVWEHVGGFEAPNLERMGFLAAARTGRLLNAGEQRQVVANYGRLQELSMGGKDSVTGHWEMMGIVTKEPFPTYPNGFPPEIIDLFQREIGSEILGNKPASGTAIIAQLGAEHVATSKPIVYTSADSVFQIACHEEVVPIERLYEMCLIARRICQPPHGVQRVIARPFVGSAEQGFTRTERRKDFPLEPPPNLADEIGDVLGIGVVPELFAGRGFRDTKRTQSNAEHTQALWTALESDARFIFANFEDFDMLYGHRNDPGGFARCLEEFDATLGDLLRRLKEGDLLVLTADHGNDPTDVSTDHSREFVPVSVYEHGQTSGRALGDVPGMTAVGATVANWLGVPWPHGTVLNH